jgi:hypothetical protein
MATEGVHSFLREHLDALPQTDAILLVAADGKLVNSSGLWPVQAFELSDREYLRRLQLDSGPGVFISAPAIDGSSGAWSFFLAHRIRGSGGELIGLVLSAIDIRYLEDLFLAVSPPNSASVTVFRRDGTMLARYPHIEAMVGGKLPADSPFYTRVEEGGGSYDMPGYGDESARIVSVYPLHDVPLVVTVSMAEDAVLVDWRRQSLFIALATLSTVIGFALLFRALAAHSRRLERSEPTLRESEANCRDFADLAKLQFLTNISHELRTPLNAILGFSEVLENGTAGPLQSRQAEYVGLIRQSGDDLLHLIDEILDLARIDAGKLDLNEEVVEPRELVDSIIALVRDRAAAGLLKLALDVEEGMPRLTADRTRLTEILLNLLSNATKFTELGGAINVIVRRTEEGGAAFVVRDNGSGMTEAEIEIALERFGPADGGIAGPHESSSLGLPLARKLAELHGGSLTLQSEKGRGTTATVILPPSRLLSLGPDDRSGEPLEVRLRYPLASGLKDDQRTGFGEGPRVPFDECYASPWRRPSTELPGAKTDRNGNIETAEADCAARQRIRTVESIQ